MDKLACQENDSHLDSEIENTLRSKLGVVEIDNTSIGCGDFIFANGDTYSGFFKANKNEKIFRDGLGIHRTADGHSYDGPWVEDVLEGLEALLTFPDGSFYNGVIKNMQYSSDGKYTFPDGTHLDAKFVKNCLVEGKEDQTHLRFKDKAGNKWIGKINTNNIIMLPVHHFIPKEWKVQIKQFPIITESALPEVPLKTSKPKLFYFCS